MQMCSKSCNFAPEMQSSDFTSGPVRDLTPEELGGSVFSDFELLSDSGHNLIYRALCSGKWVVLKAARTEEGNTTRNRLLLRREYDIMRAIDCIYVVLPWQMTEVPGIGTAIVMEYVQGRTLDAFLQEKPSLSERRRVADELMEALASLHARQIVHGDLKGTNILITDVGNHVRLIDFGFADTDAYLAKNIGTTPSIQSPEQPDTSASTADIQRDIYAFGKILSVLFPHRFRSVRKRCLNNRYASIIEVRTALRRHAVCRRLLPLAGAGLIAVLAVIGWWRTMPAESVPVPQKDTVVIVTQTPAPVLPTPKTDTIVRYQQIIVPAELQPADSLWLEIKRKAETAYNERYLLAVDSLNNMEVPNYGVANEIVHNYAMDMYYLREQFVTDYPEYEDQLHEQQRVIYGRDYTRLHKIRQSYSAVPK